MNSVAFFQLIKEEKISRYYVEGGTQLNVYLKCLHGNDLDILLREMRDLTYVLQKLKRVVSKNRLDLVILNKQNRLHFIQY